MFRIHFAILACIWLLIGCSDTNGKAPDDTDSGSSDTLPDGDTDVDTDSDSDTDSDTDTDADTDSDADTDTDADPSTGCGLAPPENGSHSIEVNGDTRTYILDVPSAYDSNTPYPIIFGFHGMSTDGELFRSRFYGNLLSAMADEVIVVHPDALGDPTAWDTDRDVPYFDALLAHLQTELCVDAGRIFATGHSSGGFFTNTLGCQRGNVLRGIAPVSGGGPFVWGGTGCTGNVAVWIAHASNDETVDFSNGEGSRDFWGEASGCDLNAPSPATPEACEDYAACDPRYPVRWCVYEDGHNWPTFAPEAMWDFFKNLL